MKVILAGCTGFAGREVLDQCIHHQSITSIVALSRRQLPSNITANPKVKVVIMDDYLSYNSTAVDEMRGADACIWTLGKAWIPDDEMAKTISIDYTMAAARAIVQSGAGTDHSRAFRFVYLSGAASERDQSKPLWFKQEYRRIRGRVETELISLSKENADVFDAKVLRSGMILQKEANLKDMVRGLAPSVRVDTLAKVMIDIAVNGYLGDTLENSHINEHGLKV